MIKLKTKYLIQLLIIYIILSIVGLCNYNFKQIWGPVNKRGFDCYDDSLRKPYLEDTISKFNLNIIGVYLPIALIIMCEFINNIVKRSAEKWCFKFVINVIITLTVFLFGLSVERLLKNVAKYKMGRLRPHFLTVCRPINMDGYECEHMDLPYMDEYECSSREFNDNVLNDIHLSFPSGHSSLIFYGMIFIICYLQHFSKVLFSSKSTLTFLLPIMQISCLFLAWCVAMSRVLDYRHHWSDVFGGLVWGSSVALVVTFCLKHHQEHIEQFIDNILNPLSVAVKASSSAKYTAADKSSQEESCTVEL